MAFTISTIISSTIITIIMMFIILIIILLSIIIIIIIIFIIIMAIVITAITSPCMKLTSASIRMRSLSYRGAATMSILGPWLTVARPVFFSSSSFSFPSPVFILSSFGLFL